MESLSKNTREGTETFQRRQGSGERNKKRKVKFSSLLSLRICTAEKLEAVREKAMCLVTDSYGLGSSNLNSPLLTVCPEAVIHGVLQV